MRTQLMAIFALMNCYPGRLIVKTLKNGMTIKSVGNGEKFDSGGAPFSFLRKGEKRGMGSG